MLTSMTPDPVTQPQAPAGDGGRPRRLHRSRDDRILAGVAGGVARYFDIDPIIVRIGFAALTVFGGFGLVAYVAAVLLVPEEGEEQPLIRSGSFGSLGSGGRERTVTYIGIALLALAAILLAGSADLFFDGDIVWPLFLAAGGALLIFGRPGRPDPGAGAPAPDAAVAPASPPRRRAGRLAFGAVLLGAAALSLAGSLDLVDGLRWDGVLAAVVVLTGVVATVAAFSGPATLTVILGFVLAGAAGVAVATDLRLEGGLGERSVAPATIADVRDEYHLAMGEMDLNLGDVAFPAGETRVEAEVSIGELSITVPDDVRVRIDGSVGAGDLGVIDRTSDGIDVDESVIREPAGGATVRTLVLDARVGLGLLRVRREGEPWPIDNRHDRRFGALPATDPGSVPSHA